MVKYSTARQKCRSGCLEFGRQSAQPLCRNVVTRWVRLVEKKKRTHRLFYVFYAFIPTRKIGTASEPSVFQRFGYVDNELS